MTIPPSRRRLAAAWLLTLILQTILAVQTFKTRLVPEGMVATRALVLGSVWEAVHLLLLAVIIPGWALYATARFLRGAPLRAWRADQLLLIWLAVPMLLFMAVLTDGALAETILRIPHLPILAVAYGAVVAVAAAATAVTVLRLAFPPPGSP
jgi:hypothetical protein